MREIFNFAFLWFGFYVFLEWSPLFQDEKAIESKGRELEKLERELEGLLEKSTKDEETLATAQKHYQAVSAGLSKNTEGEDATLADQLMGNEVSERYDQQKLFIYCMCL